LNIEQVEKLSTSNKYKIFSEDLLAYGWYFFSDYKNKWDKSKPLIEIKYGLPDFQKEIVEELRGLGKRYNRLCIVAPRGFSKSSLMSKLYAIWLVCFRKVDHLLMTTDSFTLAASYLAWIKNEFESNDKLKYYFSNLKPERRFDGTGKKWTEGDIVTRTNIMISARGTGQRVRGTTWLASRPKCIIVDDPESGENTKTKESMERNLAWLHAEVLPALSDDGWIVLTANYVKPGCMVQKKHKNMYWRSKMYAAIDKNGKSIWEAKISTAKLMEIKAELEASGDYDTFWLEYMNDVKRITVKRFDPDDFKFWMGEIYVKESKYLIIKKVGEYLPDSETIQWVRKMEGKFPVRFFMGVDPAISDKELSDFNSISTCARDSLKNVYDIEQDVFKSNSPSEIVRRIIDQFEKYGHDRIGIEVNNFQICLSESLKEDAMERGFKRLPGRVEELEHYGDKKTTRILGTLQPKVHKKRVYFRCSDEGLPMHRTLISQHEGFPYLQHDDNIDGWEMAVSVSRPAPTHDKVLINAPDNQDKGDKKRKMANLHFKRSKEKWKFV